MHVDSTKTTGQQSTAVGLNKPFMQVICKTLTACTDAYPFTVKNRASQTAPLGNTKRQEKGRFFQDHETLTACTDAYPFTIKNRASQTAPLGNTKRKGKERFVKDDETLTACTDAYPSL
uniref:Uncharacterized protein n=1 Tax=Glossina pallidipes TaxID=7398 RepID=A0A1B0A4T1_GLOPL